MKTLIDYWRKERRVTLENALKIVWEQSYTNVINENQQIECEIKKVINNISYFFMLIKKSKI